MTIEVILNVFGFITLGAAFFVSLFLAIRKWRKGQKQDSNNNHMI